MGRPIRPHSLMVTKSGPPIHPSGPLLDWLNREAVSPPGKKRRFRLPVVVRIDPCFELTDAFIGVADDPASDPVLLSLDDALMGVSLVDTIGQPYADGQAHAFWLEGYWGPVFDSEPRDSPNRWHFSVLRVHQAIVPESLRAESTHALVETYCRTPHERGAA